jgi:hypothetical protein
MDHSIPVAVRSKVKVCGLSTVGTSCSNPIEGMDIRLMSIVCSVGSGLCDELINRLEEV